MFDINKRIEQLNHYYLYKSDVQIVCNYLKFFDKMKKQNLFFYGLNQKDPELVRYKYYHYYWDSQFISDKECNTLLNQYFIKKNKSYHQIYIYIKVLAEQLRKFSNNHELMIETLMANKMNGEIRKDIIQAFLELTSYFTIGAFDKIISEQDSSIFNISYSKDYNQKEKMDEAANK